VHVFRLWCGVQVPAVQRLLCRPGRLTLGVSPSPPIAVARQHHYRPTLTDVAPAFAADLERELRAQGDAELAEQIPGLRVLSFCGCGDTECASFTTREPSNRSPDRQVETMTVDALDGMVNIDSLDGRIMYVEVLYRPDLRAALEAGFRRDGIIDSADSGETSIQFGRYEHAGEYQ
jgi:hypothetical protein